MNLGWANVVGYVMLAYSCVVFLFGFCFSFVGSGRQRTVGNEGGDEM